MKLYYCPGACSLADHIALIEAGVDFDREAVDLRTKKTASGVDFNTIAAKGYVPVLVLENGERLTENVAVLDWIAGQFPQFAVEGPLGRTRVLEALTYISTEIHRAFKPMWHHGSIFEVEKARRTIVGQLAYLEAQMKGAFLFGDKPSVADFYLFVMLTWARRFDVPLSNTMDQLHQRLAGRPAVREAMAVEGLAA